MTFLKQQVQTDQRAVDIVAQAEIYCKTSSLGHDPTKASEADFYNFYEKFVSPEGESSPFRPKNPSVAT